MYKHSWNVTKKLILCSYFLMPRLLYPTHQTSCFKLKYLCLYLCIYVFQWIYLQLDLLILRYHNFIDFSPGESNYRNLDAQALVRVWPEMNIKMENNQQSVILGIHRTEYLRVIMFSFLNKKKELWVGDIKNNNRHIFIKFLKCIALKN